MELLFVYLWLKLDALITVLVFGAVIIFCISIGAAIGNFTSSAWEQWRQQQKKRTFFGVLFVIVAVLVPTSKDTAILIGTHYAVKLANSPEGEKVVSLIRKKANDYLEEQLKPATVNKEMK